MIAHMITSMQVYFSYTDEKCEGCAGLIAIDSLKHRTGSGENPHP